MLSSHLKKILPNLSIISPLSQSCQHNRQDRTGLSPSLKKKKRGSSPLFFSISPFPSITTSPPSLHTKLIGWKERERGMGRRWRWKWRGVGGWWKTLCIWKCPERGVIYVCIRCRFHYGPVAQVRSFQEHRGDLIKLSLITGHTGSGGKLLTEERKGAAKGEKKKKKRERER